MADDTVGRGLVIAAAVMVIGSQALEMATDLLRRQFDPPEAVALVVLIVLAFLLARRIRWARWVVVVLAVVSGLTEVLGIALLVATALAPGFWSPVVSAAPFLASIHTMLVAFPGGQPLPLLIASLVVSAALDLTAAGMLVFAPSVRTYFASPASG